MQAALASLPLEAVNKAYPPGSPNYAQYHQWATDALTVAVFEVIISGTLGCLLVRWLSPLLLSQVHAAGYKKSFASAGFLYPDDFRTTPQVFKLQRQQIQTAYRLLLRKRLPGPWARRRPANTGCESMRPAKTLSRHVLACLPAHTRVLITMLQTINVRARLPTLGALRLLLQRNSAAIAVDVDGSQLRPWRRLHGWRSARSGAYLPRTASHCL